jgi:IS605 OrfB family transposase
MNLELPKPKKQAGSPEGVGLQVDASKLDKSKLDKSEPDEGKPEKKARVKRQKEGLLRKGQKVRIYPTKDQETLLTQWIGSGRYLWNMALAKQNEHYELHKKHLSTAELSKETTALRKEPGMEWLGEVPRTALVQTLGRLDKSWGAFFDGVSGKRQDSPGKPKFRSRGGSRESATFQADHRKSAIFRLMESPKDGTCNKEACSENENPGNDKIGDGSSQEAINQGAISQEAISQEAIDININHEQTQSQSQAAITVGPGELRIPGLGWVKAIFSEPVFGEVSSVTVKQEELDWYASLSLINVEPSDIRRNESRKLNFDFPGDNPTCHIANPGRVGMASIDASVPYGGIATSDGLTTYSLFTEEMKKRAAKAEEGRVKYQKATARKHDFAMEKAGYKRNKDGTWPKRDKQKFPKSKREEDLRKYSAGISLKQLFCRLDAIHKFTTDLVMRHHTIVVETLILTAMARSLSRGFRRKMHEACMGEVIRQLKYKCEWHNRTLIFASQWFASSKRCSNTECYKKNAELKLGDRTWICSGCDKKHERDDNAAFNLWQEGWRLLEEVFQKNNTTCLAAGSVVRGSQGLIAMAEEKKARKVRAPKAIALALSD